MEFSRRSLSFCCKKSSTKRTILFAATVLVAIVAQAADNGLPADFDPVRLTTYGRAADQLPSVPTVKPGGPKLKDLVIMPSSQEKEDSTLILTHGLSAGTAPTRATILGSCRGWVAQSNIDQGRLVEVEYATGFTNVVEVYGPKVRTVTIGEIADSLTRVCREHLGIPPQLAALGIIIRFQADKPTEQAQAATVQLDNPHSESQ